MMNTQLKIQLSRRLQSKAHEKALLMTPQGGAAITTQCFELPIEEEGKKIPSFGQNSLARSKTMRKVSSAMGNLQGGVL